jgi:hypothetical protein
MEPIFLSESLHTETRRVFSRRKTASVVPRRVRTTMNHQSNPPVFLQSKKPARPTHRSECWLGEGREGKHTGKGEHCRDDEPIQPLTSLVARRENCLCDWCGTTGRLYCDTEIDGGAIPGNCHGSTAVLPCGGGLQGKDPRFPPRAYS